MQLKVKYQNQEVNVELEYQTSRHIFTHVDAARASVRAFGHRKGVKVMEVGGEKIYCVHQNTVEKVKEW